MGVDDQHERHHRKSKVDRRFGFCWQLLQAYLKPRIGLSQVPLRFLLGWMDESAAAPVDGRIEAVEAPDIAIVPEAPGFFRQYRSTATESSGTDRGAGGFPISSKCSSD